MSLKINRGAIIHPQKVVLYGVEGVGKTTLAAQFPDPLFIDTEGGTEGYDVARTQAPQSWTALKDLVRAVAAERWCWTRPTRPSACCAPSCAPRTSGRPWRR